MNETPIERYCTDMASGALQLPFDDLNAVATSILECYRRGGTVYLAGNGGSAATASHFACDLTKGTRAEGARRIRVVALSDNIPLITAWGNDSSYDRIFAEQLIPLGAPADLLIVMSASGNSPNVLEAVRAANTLGMQTIAFAGPDGGKMAGLADLTVRVPGRTIEQIEDLHSIITHGLTVTLRGLLTQEARAGVGDAASSVPR